MHPTFETTNRPWRYHWVDNSNETKSGMCIQVRGGHPKYYFGDPKCGWLIAEVQNPADAQLISAAPDLRDALMNLLSGIEQGGISDKAIAEAKSALQKANEPLGGVGYADRLQLQQAEEQLHES